MNGRGQRQQGLRDLCSAQVSEPPIGEGESAAIVEAPGTPRLARQDLRNRQAEAR